MCSETCTCLYTCVRVHTHRINKLKRNHFWGLVLTGKEHPFSESCGYPPLPPLLRFGCKKWGTLSFSLSASVKSPLPGLSAPASLPWVGGYFRSDLGILEGKWVPDSRGGLSPPPPNLTESCSENLSQAAVIGRQTGDGPASSAELECQKLWYLDAV